MPDWLKHVSEFPKLTWKADYRDGSSLLQFSGGEEHSSEKIDREKLVRFSLVDENNQELFPMEIPAGCRFFFRRRKALSETGLIESQVILFGYEFPGEASSLKCRVVFADLTHQDLEQWVVPSAWFDPVQLVPAEFQLVGDSPVKREQADG